MKRLIFFSLCFACKTHEGVQIPNDPELRAKIIKYENLKIDCLRTSANDEEYLKCIEFQNYEDLKENLNSKKAE